MQVNSIGCDIMSQACSHRLCARCAALACSARFARAARPLRGLATCSLLLVTSHEVRGSRVGCAQALGRCAASLVTRCAAVAARSLLRAACNEWRCCATLAALRVTARRSRRCCGAPPARCPGSTS